LVLVELNKDPAGFSITYEGRKIACAISLVCLFYQVVDAGTGNPPQTIKASDPIRVTAKAILTAKALRLSGRCWAMIPQSRTFRSRIKAGETRLRHSRW